MHPKNRYLSGKKIPFEKYLPCEYGRSILPLLAILFLTLVVGCATGQGVRLPPVTPTQTGEVIAGKFVWIDLLTEDVLQASSFYGRLFGWRAIKSEENEDYFLFFKGDKPVAGMVATENKDSKGSESLWLLSLSVEDVDRAVAVTRERGGKVLAKPLDAAGRGRMALVSDPAGAPLILLRASGGDPVDRTPEIGEWLWTDLFTRNARNGIEFYSALAGYGAERLELREEHRYQVFKRDGHPRAGVVELGWEGLEDNWLPYFKVADVDSTVEKARQGGGGLIVRSGDVAILSDPTGAAFGVQQPLKKRSQ